MFDILEFALLEGQSFQLIFLLQIHRGSEFFQTLQKINSELIGIEQEVIFIGNYKFLTGFCRFVFLSYMADLFYYESSPCEDFT